MRFNPSHPRNYNGFYHPDYLDHLKPHIQNLHVEIDGVEVPDSNAIEWAEKGMLESINLFGACATYESMVVKGMGKQLASFIQDYPDDTDQSLFFLHDYYFGTPDQSMSALLGVLDDSKRLIHDINVISSICIHDLDFTDSDGVVKFLLKNLNANEQRYARCNLKYHFHHYLRDPVDIAAWKHSASSAYDWAMLATFQASVGDSGAARRSLIKAERVANLDFYARQKIARSYLFLLGDFDCFWDAIRVQIESCTDTFTWLETVADLCCYIGSPEALKRARVLMNLAEIASDGSYDYKEIALAWKLYFNDMDRADYCRKIAGIYGKSKEV